MLRLEGWDQDAIPRISAHKNGTGLLPIRPGRRLTAARTQEDNRRQGEGRMERKLAAIFHADVQGYSRLIAQDEVTTLRTVASHLAMMRTLVEQHKGRAVGSRGDSLLAEFPSVVEAVQCAVEVQ